MECPICNTIDCNSYLTGNDTGLYGCKRCGDFSLPLRAESELSDINQRKRAAISHWLRKNQKAQGALVLDMDAIEELLTKCELPNPREQVDNIIYWLGQNQKTYASPATESIKKIESIMGCTDYPDLDFILKHLKKGKIISTIMVGGDQIRLALTMEGWGMYEELVRTNVKSRFAFMAMKFGVEPLTTIYRNTIKPAVSATGYELRKLDDIKKAGSIDDKLRIEIRRSKFLIADLTHANNGAYWESGFAEGIGIPVIYTCEKSIFDDAKTKPHFDTNHHLTVIWENTPAGLESFADELKSTIRETLQSEAKNDD